MDLKHRIRQMFFHEHKSIRAISRDLTLHRDTVRSAIRDPEPPEYRRKGSPAQPIMGPAKEFIDSVLLSDETAPRKQRHTAKRIFDRLVAEHQFKGGESTVRHYVAGRKHDLKIDHVTAGGPAGGFAIRKSSRAKPRIWKRQVAIFGDSFRAGVVQWTG